MGKAVVPSFRDAASAWRGWDGSYPDYGEQLMVCQKRLFTSGTALIAAAAMGGGLAAQSGSCWAGVVPSVGAEYAYQVPNSTGTGQAGFTLVLSGNQTGNIPSGGYENTMASAASSASYGSGSTTISYSGSAVSTGNAATFGFSWTGAAAPDITNAYWNGASSTDIPLLETIGAGSSGTEYAVISIDPAQMDSIFELHTTPSWDNRWSANNGPIDLSGAEYFISPSEIPLDQLNNADLSSEPWQPIPGIPNGTQVQNGGSFSSPVPEPAPLVLLTIGVGVSLLAGCKQGRKAR